MTNSALESPYVLLLTEKSLISSINGLKNKMTLITITHRLSTLEKKNVDQVIELKNGKVIPIKI